MSDTPPAFMQGLLDHGADANFCRDADDDPPLYHQVQAGNTEQAAVLLQNGANANYANEFGNTILHFAQTAPLVKLLLAHGANPAADQWYPLGQEHPQAFAADVVHGMLEQRPGDPCVKPRVEGRGGGDRGR